MIAPVFPENLLKRCAIRPIDLGCTDPREISWDVLPSLCALGETFLVGIDHVPIRDEEVGRQSTHCLEDFVALFRLAAIAVTAKIPADDETNGVDAFLRRRARFEIVPSTSEERAPEELSAKCAR